ncbi:MAG TPA: GNAT family N-acetyltransferase [Acetobacteraceae bacterium]|jgi:GNAT superfamily N-acetyltransferase
MTIGWITEAPIRKADSKEEAVLLLKQLKKNMKGWDKPSGIPERTSGSEWATDQWAVWPRQREKWIDRAQTSQGLVEDFIDELGDEDVWFYMVAGQPIGAMSLRSEEGFIHIEYLVTHPGSSDGGGALIQKAVQLSSKAGKGGKVRLCAGNENAHDMYEHMGFVDIEDAGPDDMELNPATSGEWVPSNGSYRYKSYVGGSRWAA